MKLAEPKSGYPPKVSQGQGDLRGKYNDFFSHLVLPKKSRVLTITLASSNHPTNLSTTSQSDADLVRLYLKSLKNTADCCDFFVEWVKASNTHPDLPWSFWSLALTGVNFGQAGLLLHRKKNNPIAELINHHFALVKAIRKFRSDSAEYSQCLRVTAIFFVIFAAIFFMVCPHVIFSFPTLVAFLGPQLAAWSPIVFGGLTLFTGSFLIYNIVSYFTEVLGRLNVAQDVARYVAQVRDARSVKAQESLQQDIEILKESLNTQATKSSGTYLFSFWPDFSSMPSRLSATAGACLAKLR